MASDQEIIDYCLKKLKLTREQVSEKIQLGKKLAENKISSTQYIFVDGSSYLYKSSASAVFFGDDDPRNCAIPFPFKDHTNNRAELYALLKAYQYLKDHGDRNVKYIIVSDSALCVNTVKSWAEQWEARGWKKADGEVPKNLDLIQPLIREVRTVREKYIDCELKTLVSFGIKSHQKKLGKDHPHYFIWYGNMKADEMCNKIAKEMLE